MGGYQVVVDVLMVRDNHHGIGRIDNPGAGLRGGPNRARTDVLGLHIDLGHMVVVVSHLGAQAQQALSHDEGGRLAYVRGIGLVRDPQEQDAAAVDRQLSSVQGEYGAVCTTYSGMWSLTSLASSTKRKVGPVSTHVPRSNWGPREGNDLRPLDPGRTA